MTGKQNATLALAGVAAVAAAAAALRRTGAVQAADTVHLDQETLDLLVALGTAVGDIDQQLPQILAALQGRSQGEGGITVQGWPGNRSGIRTRTIILPAVGTAYRLPDFPIPSGYSVLVKADPTNAGFIYVGESASDVTDIPGGTWPLIPNEGVAYQVDNVNRVYVSPQSANDRVCWTVEK